MDPNITQPAGTNPVQQPIGQVPPANPVPQTPPPAPPIQPAQSPSPSSQNIATGAHGKRTLLLFIILLLVLSASGYFIFVKSTDNTKQAPAQTNRTIAAPSNTPTPTTAVPESAESVEILSPEVDLEDLDTELDSL